ncbi:DUF3375 domain-containing protein [Nocardioides ultimimeridianus]
MSDSDAKIAGMSALASALAYQRLVTEHASLRMLRADHAAVAAALLAAHLGKPGARLAADDLYELIDADLEVLRDHFELPQTARAYCDAWRRDGFIVRRPSVGTRGETLELSPEGHVALRVFAQLDEPRSTVTQSRLLSLAQAVRQLAIDTDPEADRRLTALHAERDRIDEAIARIKTGDFEVLDNRSSLERVNEVLLQAQDLPADFAGVRSRFEQLNHELRARILEVDDAQSSVLDDVFRGVDLIESSDEGQTFSAFSMLIRDPERSSALDSDLSAVLDRDFVRTLSPEARRTLRSLVHDLKHNSREVHAVLTEFARGLRRYVYSQEFQRDRALRDALQEALAAAVPASRQVRPTSAFGQDIELSSLRLSSVGEINVHDPTEYDTGTALGDAEAGTVDLIALAAIARESEIDFTELIDNVNLVVAQRRQVSVGEVLGLRPATQGLASIVGLLSLATTYGEVDPLHTEHLDWLGADGVAREADVVVHTFSEAIA